MGMRNVPVDSVLQRRNNRLANLLDDVQHAGEIAEFEGWLLGPIQTNAGVSIVVTHKHENWITFTLTRPQVWDMLVVESLD